MLIEIKSCLSGEVLHTIESDNIRTAIASLVRQEANLSRANLYGADLRRANFSGANLRGANLSGARI